MKRGRKPKTERNKAIIKLVKGGSKYKDIIKQFGLTKQRISQIVLGCG